MVDEVVARERVDDLALAAQVRGGDGDELAVARRRRDPAARCQEPLAIRREQRCGDEDQRIVARARRLDDRRDRRVVADDEPTGRWCMPTTIASAADTALTPP